MNDDLDADAARLVAGGWASKDEASSNTLTDEERAMAATLTDDAIPPTELDYEWFWYGADWWIVKRTTDQLVSRGATMRELNEAARRLPEGAKLRRNRKRDFRRVLPKV